MSLHAAGSARAGRQLRVGTSSMMKFNTQDLKYAKLVDEYSRHIKSPVLRLKFLNSALGSRPTRRTFSKLPIAGPLRERMELIVELAKVLPPTQRAPWSFRATSVLYRLRFLLYAACCAGVLAACAGVVYVGSKVVNKLAVSTQAKSAVTAEQPDTSSPGADVVASIGSEAGVGLDRVWLAESGEGYEFYSNGARVLTQFETVGPQRRFYRFSLEGLSSGTEQAELAEKPGGIVYHLSEGDLLPFADRYNKSLMHHSKGLLDYARSRELYNYVIDRFGRTYRIVRDEYASNHAGNSLWSDGKSVYVNLSSSFIGICLEGRSGSGTGPDGINEAQIYAARVLTAVLRSKYGIEDANCVTHGLVSVNPSNKLMGYHTDWLSGFPFEALGLTSKYNTELVAISRFGFNYDQQYVRAGGGKRWPGLEQSDAALREAAAVAGVSEEDQRRSLWPAFQRVYSKEPQPEQDSAGGEQ
jgi:hypothetical protein